MYLPRCNLQHQFIYLMLWTGEYSFLIILTERILTKTMWDYGAKQMNSICLYLQVKAIVCITHY